MTEEEKFITTVENSTTKKEVINKMGWMGWKSGLYRKFEKMVQLTEVDTSHFLKNGKWNEVDNKIIKICPVCENKFETRTNSKEKTTCSHACSNTFFRSGANHGNWDHSTDFRHDYVKTCFEIYPYKCLLCDWSICVEVHHIDRDRSNNHISNLVPLCPNHHKAIHKTKEGVEFEKQIKELKIT